MATPASRPAGPELVEAGFARRAPAFALRRAGPDDADFLFALFAEVQPPPQLPAPLLRLQFDSQSSAYAQTGAVHWIVLNGDRPIGRFMLDFGPADRVHGVDLAVLPGERAGAAGLHLLRAWTAACDRLGLDATLSVAPANPARLIYRRLGFTETDLYTAPIPMRRSTRKCRNRSTFER